MFGNALRVRAGGVSFAERLLASALAAALVVAPAGCAALRTALPMPSARIDKVDLQGISLSGVTLRFDVEVKNPYGSDLPLLGLDYVLSTSGKRFLDGSVPSDHTIPAQGSDVVPMSVRVPFSALTDVGETVRPGAVIPWRADMKLRIRTPVVGDIGVPVDSSGEIRIPSFP